MSCKLQTITQASKSSSHKTISPRNSLYERAIFTSDLPSQATYPHRRPNLTSDPASQATQPHKRPNLTSESSSPTRHSHQEAICVSELSSQATYLHERTVLTSMPSLQTTIRNLFIGTVSFHSVPDPKGARHHNFRSRLTTFQNSSILSLVRTFCITIARALVQISCFTGLD